MTDCGNAPGRVFPLALTSRTVAAASGAPSLVRSIASLLGPGRLITCDRSWTVGTASCARGSSCVSSCCSLGATGLVALTSGVSTSSAPRTFANVVIASRMNPGSRWIDWPSAVRCAASASVVVARFDTRPLRSLLRCESVETSWPDLTMKFVKLPVSRSISANNVALEAIAGFRYAHPACASLPRPAYCEADPWITSWRPFNVGALSVLNS